MFPMKGMVLRVGARLVGLLTVVKGRMRTGVLILPLAVLSAVPLQSRAEPLEWNRPRCWMSVYLDPDVSTFYPCAADLAAHGVGGFSCDPRRNDRDRVERWLTFARRRGLKVMDEVVGLGNNPTQGVRPELRAGLSYDSAVMIGGIYRGKAIDRHVFAFSADRHEIIVEPPEVMSGKPYQPLGQTFKAEVVVPLKPFDGRQHLKVIAADVEQLEGRKAKLSFDLTGLDGSLLDKVGIACYWRDDPMVDAWQKRMSAHITPFSPSTREMTRRLIRWCLDPWVKANGGKFPSDTVTMLRFGDECFLVTNPIGGGSVRVNYPVWDYCELALVRFAEVAPGLEYPRTWGFPEIYGADAYAIFLSNLHKACAELVAVAVQEAKRYNPDMKVIRNTTRFGVWSMENDHDGSGNEMLAKALDVIHLDPYGVRRNGYDITVIPDDMGYLSGFSRRFGKPLMPWLQAHEYGDLVTPSADDIRRIFGQHLPFAPDAIMWLGYGLSHHWGVPGCDADEWRKMGGASSASWEAVGEIHRRFDAMKPQPRPKARLAVLRPYVTRAICCHSDGGFRNPADEMLRYFLRVWTMEKKGFFDTFEILPHESPAEKADRERELKNYDWIVSTVPYPGALVIGAGTEGTILTERQIIDMMPQFRKTIEGNLK